MTRKYAAALGSYVRRGGEAELQQAYEIGRHCLAEGRSILDMIAIHYDAIWSILNATKPSRVRLETLQKAREFFTETMSPYEMTHRAFGEGNQTLRRINETLEEQARYIARELHDESGQLLAAVHIELDEVTRDLPHETRARLQGVKKLLDQVEIQLRALSHELRPTVLDDLGLAAALDTLAQRLAKRSGLRINFQPFNGARLPSKVEVALYRIVQEGLNNVIKHAKATDVTIRLRRMGSVVACLIADNGVGFDLKSLNVPGRSGLGLMGIQERLQALGGEVQIESGPGKGTKIKIRVPLEIEYANNSNTRR